MQQDVYQEFNELEGRHWWFRGRRQFLRKLIEKCFTQKSNLAFCEIGSGTGGNLPMLASYAKVDAVEMNPIALKAIEGKNIQGVAKIVSGFLPDGLPELDTYHGVFALDVLEHIDDDVASLDKIFELIKPGGYLVATVPAYQWMWSQHDVANHHKRRYTRAQFVDRVRQAGFQVEYASYFNSFLFPLAAVVRMLDRETKSGANAETTRTLSLPPNWLNGLLLFIFRIESLWAGKLRIPFGVSIAITAKRPQATT